MDHIYLGVNTVSVLIVLLLFNPQSCFGFNRLFAFEEPFGSDSDGQVASLTLPTVQDRLVFQPTLPVPVHGKQFDRLTVFKNGFIALDDESARRCAINYPENSLNDGRRLKNVGENYLSVFSSVNDGLSGRVVIREVNLNVTEAMGCANRIQIERLQKLIRLHYSKMEDYAIRSIIWIIWENMTNAQYQNSKSNSYSVVILHNGEKAYAVLQYWNIEWPDVNDYVSDAAPPEAGIFIQPSNGYQLPRSGHSVNTSLWMSESNVVLPGEWLVPLYDAPVESDDRLEWMPRIAREFLISLSDTCHRDVGSNLWDLTANNVVKTGTRLEVLNDSPNSRETAISSTSSSWDHDFYTDELEEEYDPTEQDVVNGTENFWDSYHEEARHGGSVEHEHMMSTESETDETEYSIVEPTIVPEYVIHLETAGAKPFVLSTDEASIEPKSYVLSTEGYNIGNYVSGSETEQHRYPTQGPSQLETCDPFRECTAANTDCYQSSEGACCVCREGFYGSGDTQCWDAESDYNFAFRGNLTISLAQYSGTRTLPVYLDVQTGRSKRSSSGIRNGIADDTSYQVVRLLTPMFHVLNGIFATPCQNQTSPEYSRPYNLFSLGGSFRGTFRLQFYFAVEHVGKFNVKVELKLESETSQSYARGSIDVQVSATEPNKQLVRAYREAGNVGDRNFYASYHVDNYGRIVFPENSVHLVPESRATTGEEQVLDDLTVRWSAVAESVVLAGAASNCLLRRDSVVPRDHPFYLRLLDRGYCSEDCASTDGTCNLFCVDVPLLSSTEPDVCSCITCPSEGEICVPEGGVYSCQCKPGLKRMDDHTCRDVSNPKRQCGSVDCHKNARCLDSTQGFCQCIPGFRGDGLTRCEEDPCARCQRNEICINDVCKPSGVNLCEGIQCGKEAVCRDGACICNPGYTGDPLVECIEERDQCYGVHCHANARCSHGTCQCVAGFVGDGYYECKSQSPHEDRCSRVACHPYARCHQGHCNCIPGFEGDGFTVCTQIGQDPCRQIQCHRDGYCVDGTCRCREGYKGDGYWDCQRIRPDPCALVKCHHHATCENGLCLCAPGFRGDGYIDCVPSGDPCEGVHCHHYGKCDDGRCLCSEGYEGDGVRECKPITYDLCDGVSCHSNGYCHEGRCVCHDGFEGDGYWECRPSYVPKMIDPCDGIQCHRLAYCEQGRCLCNKGYEGDGYWDCKPSENDPCQNVRCDPYARCIQGVCHCVEGYQGDGYYECRPEQQQKDLCEDTKCHPNGYCRDGRCFCRVGYSGDGYWVCNQEADLCVNVRCHEFAHCQAGRCYCRQGYEGDGYYECRAAYELCAGVQCHRFGQCYQNRCYCSHGYVGDGVNFCDVHTVDPCDGIHCAANGLCQDGRCSCLPGFEGDGYNQCNPIENHTDSQLRMKFGPSICVDQDCHPYAQCVDNRCTCKPGYEGDGYLKCKRQTGGSRLCGQCRGIPLKELAQCIDGKCTCVPGYVEAHPGVCMECVQSNCHPEALCLQTPMYNNTFSCQCKSGYVGDGVNACQPLRASEPEQPSIDSTCGGGCSIRNSDCNRRTGRCECRPGYDWDGRSQCVWNCRLCIADAICDHQNERCACKPGYYGDGQTYCELLPTRPDPVKVHIAGQGEVHRLADLERPLVLYCYVSTKDESVTGQWSQPKGAQIAEISINRLSNGTEMVLRIPKPSLTDVGRYFCRAGQVEAFIDVTVEETAIPFDIFLTSDDGILKVRSSNQNSTLATLWNLAENNKYGRVSMVTDCKSQRVIYTSDYGHSLRWGNANLNQKELVTTEIHQSQLNRYRNLAVDPPSGNIFAWDEAFGKLVVLNPAKPHMRHTLDTIGSLKHAEPLRFAGLVAHSTKGLLYWATFTDGWMPNGTIQVASMTGENEAQLLQLNGEPLVLSLSPSYDSSDSSAGRVCWIQRSIVNMFALTTEMHCARLSANGREVTMRERLRQFNPTEEPSWGMVHHRGTVLWTDAARPVYYSANPDRRVLVRLVCCSNRFQSIAALAKCDPALNNACGYSNGRCRYFCLPNEDQRSRKCVCPDSEPGCHKEM